MRLIRFTTADSPSPRFGVVVRDHAIAFATLQDRAGKSNPHLADSQAYLAHLPESEKAARELLAWAEQHGGESEGLPLDAVRLLEPVEVAALFDFGLTPRHLKNSGETIGKYEKDNPQSAPLLQAFARAVMAPKAKPPAGQPEPLSYYKGNMNTIVGDGETVPWPAYTSRLDVEPGALVGLFSEPGETVVLAVYEATLNDTGAVPVAADDLVDLDWFPLARLPDLAFERASDGLVVEL